MKLVNRGRVIYGLGNIILRESLGRSWMEEDYK